MQKQRTREFKKKHAFENQGPTDKKVYQPGSHIPTNARPISFLGDLHVCDREATHGEFQYPHPKPAPVGEKVHRYDDE